jgi:Cof subfamily protein (haloacid dehalogenase superfamily)
VGTVPPEVVICDLDGTLLGPDAELSGRAREGLNAILATGVPLTVATSRRTHSVRDKLAGVAIRLPVIEINGAFVSELASGQRLVSNILDPATARAAIEVMVAAGADPVISAWNGCRDQVHFHPRLNEGSAWFVAGKRHYAEVTDLIESDALAEVADPVAAVTGFVPDADGDALVGRLQELLGESASVYGAANFYRHGWTEVQVQDPRAEKGAAIPSFLAEAGLEGSPVVACGDHLNDVGLMKAADVAVAPANAHPQILELADEVVASNQEDGVIHWLLERYLPGAGSRRTW